MKQLLPCPDCHAPAPDHPIITRIKMGGGIWYRCPGCNTERVIPWGIAGIELIERARKEGVTEE